MSESTDRPARAHGRHAFALLFALVTLAVAGLCTLALWHTHASATRSDHLRLATLHHGDTADSLLALGVAATLGGAWRGLPYPGATVVTHQGAAHGGVQTATIARVGWHSLLVRGLSTGRSGVSAVQARANARLLLPLHSPMVMPAAALTAPVPWHVDPGASVTFAPSTPGEMRCREGVVPLAVLADSLAVRLDTITAIPLDPDTVSAPLVGVFRLIRDRITRPMVVHGMVESVSGLFIGADLQIVGVLVVQGSVQPAGGQLDVTGAVIARDSGGAGSVLGNGDRVRYDACAIRRAVDRATRPAPAVAWTTVGRF